MSKLFSRISGFFSSKSFMGIDKAGNRYFARKEEIDGVMKEKRWVLFKGEDDPTSIPVEWICWLNGQRKKAPTPEEMEELAARRERVRQNVALRKKEEEEENKLKAGTARKGTPIIGKSVGPDLRSFIRQFPATSKGDKAEEVADTTKGLRNRSKIEEDNDRAAQESSEPTGSGATYRPGTWQPPA